MKLMARNGRLPVSIRRFLMSARSFCDFLVEKGTIKTNPARNIPVPEVEKSIPEILTEQEAVQLLEWPSEDCNSDIELRDKAMLELLYATGIRVSELVGMNIDDVNLEQHSVQCGKQKRSIPIYHRAFLALNQYILTVRPRIAQKNEIALFVNKDGERLSRQGFWKIIKKRAKDAGIPKKVSPHTIRHSFGAHLLENGADLQSIQKLMGHSDISSTIIYKNYIRKEIRNVYMNSHPRAKG